jgi:hypothetical protein
VDLHFLLFVLFFRQMNVLPNDWPAQPFLPQGFRLYHRRLLREREYGHRVDAASSKKIGI